VLKMKFSLGFTGFAAAAVALFAMQGCAADAADGDVGEDGVGQEELRASAARLVGAYHSAGESVRPPTFEGIVFKANGDFLADIDTGIRCVMAPCPSHVRLLGKFTATRSTLRLIPMPGEEASEFFGRYAYTLVDGKLSLERGGAENKWTDALTSGASYCTQPSDCEGQGLFVPMCVGSFTCGETRSCGFRCGVPVSVFPSDTTKLVAENKGGGFAPPPPAGSRCALGASKYELDVKSSTLTFTECSFKDFSTPFVPVSGTKQLSAAQLASVVAAAKSVSITTQEMCGADKPFLEIEVTSPSQGKKTYADSFYSCMGEGRTYVDNIDEVFSAFRAITQTH
jgi:hypothetical protein